jgi:hypothetical protein
MADEWYCEIAGREIGPLSSEQLRVMAAKGQILPSDCVRQGSQGVWILARQVKGLLPPAVEMPRAASAKPATLPKVPPSQCSVSAKPELGNGGRAKRVSVSGSLPVAQPLSRASVMPSSASLPLPPAAAPPPLAADVFDPVALGIVEDPAAVKTEVQANKSFVRSRERQRLERQKVMVGVLAAAVVILAISALVLCVGGSSSQPARSGAATPAKKTPAAKPAASPEALEAREGVERLDSPKPQPPKTDADPAKKPTAAVLGHAKTAATSDSTKAAAAKKPREPKPGTPEADFGLPMVDE